MAFARRQFELSAPQDDGQPLIAHLESYRQQTGKLHPMMRDAPMLPDGLEMLWLDFLELHSCRGSAGFGVSRITYSDIAQFKSVTGTMLQPFEIDLIRRADNIWLSEFAPKPKGDK